MMTTQSAKITGSNLIDAGFQQGAWFAQALPAANDVLARHGSFEEAMEVVRKLAPPPTIGLQSSDDIILHENMDVEGELEEANRSAVLQSMKLLLKTPGVKAGAFMPDACPAGPMGTIPVGGVIASEGIHPGMHSADVCCSMAISVVPGVSPKQLLDAAHSVTHFGGGGRPRGQQWRPSDEVMARFEANDFLRGIQSKAIEQFGTQGDGNHFAYVGTLKSTGQTALVTHHGSRAPGAALYSRGMKIADKFRRAICPTAKQQNGWIPADTTEGEIYWDALQAVRLWTRGNHFAIHDKAVELLSATVADRFWNEHNFVFRKSDGLFYHAKGATPAFKGWADDATDLTMIPLNMAEPILIVRGSNADRGLGFSPHGAGRNFSRSAHKRALAGRSDAEVFAEETKGLDARFFSGRTDVSELPSAYKNAASVRGQIEKFGLAEIVDEVLPYGSIMAGDWEYNAPWRVKARKRHAAAETQVSS